nr:hypothetical protein [Tanacetum cinerariifolium]
MHILNEPSFFLTNKTGASQGEELGHMKPLSESSCSCFDNSFISDGAKWYGAWATGAAHGIRSIWNSTGRAGGRPGKSSGNTSGKSWTIEHKITVNRDSLPIVMSPQPVHTDNGVDTTQFYGHKYQVVFFRDILPLEKLLVVSGDVIRLSLAIRFSFRI